MNEVASFYMREINRKSDRFKAKYKNFLFRINRKLNESSFITADEENKLKEIHQSATELPRVKR